MASALDYMHRTASKTHTYVWRDLKPDNIGFTANETLKIFGERFGYSRTKWSEVERSEIHLLL